MLRIVKPCFGDSFPYYYYIGQFCAYIFYTVIFYDLHDPFLLVIVKNVVGALDGSDDKPCGSIMREKYLFHDAFHKFKQVYKH